MEQERRLGGGLFDGFRSMIIIMNHEYALLELAHLLGYLDGFFFGAEVPVRFIRITSDDLPTSTGAGHDVMFYSTHNTLLMLGTL